MSIYIQSRDGKYRLFSSMNNQPLTEFVDAAAAKDHLANSWLFREMLHIVELFMTFPDGWPKSNGNIYTNREGVLAYRAWCESLPKENKEYVKAIVAQYEALTGRKSPIEV